MWAEFGAERRRDPTPGGIWLEEVSGLGGIVQLTGVHERVFGADESELRASLQAQLSTAPEVTAMVVAMAGDQPVCAGRIGFVPGSDFAGLWGGGTLPPVPGRGIYRALAAYRADLAAARGYRYLQ